MKSFKIGLELYSVRDVYDTDVLTALKKTKQAGYNAVEFPGGVKMDAYKLKDMLDQTGLECCGWHTPWDYFRTDLLYSFIAYNKIIGNKYIIIPGLPGELTQTAEDWLKLCVRFNELTEILGEQGMYTGMHSHAGEMKATTNGMLPWDIIAQNTSKDFQLQLDIGNTLDAGVDPVALLQKYEGRYRTIHYKPYSKASGFKTPIGQDDIDWATVVNFCEANGNTEYAIVEYEELDGFNGVKQCFDGIQKFL